MTIEVNATITSYQQRSIEIQTQSQQARIGVSSGRPPPTSAPSEFSNQEQQIIDDVGISAEAIEQLQAARALADQLQDYLDYLNSRAPQNVLLTDIDGPENPNAENVQINAQATSLSASISYTETTATQTSVSAEFTDEGELINLEIDQIRVSERELNVELQSQILDLSIQP
ncbi:MAG: hypothetical protein AAGB32_00315 [Pseudomonadota bacterium]